MPDQTGCIIILSWAPWVSVRRTTEAAVTTLYFRKTLPGAHLPLISGGHESHKIGFIVPPRSVQVELMKIGARLARHVRRCVLGTFTGAKDPSVHAGVGAAGVAAGRSSLGSLKSEVKGRKLKKKPARMSGPQESAPLTQVLHPSGHRIGSLRKTCPE